MASSTTANTTTTTVLSTSSFLPPALSFLSTTGQLRQRISHHSFSYFSHLPPELRQYIYKLSLPQRILSVRYNSTTNTFSSSTPLPALLSTCVESRMVARKHYALCFGTTTSRPQIYFDPILDTLYLPRCSEMGYDEDFRIMKSLNVEETAGEVDRESSTSNKKGNRLDQLRRVAIDHVDVQIKRPWEGYNKASFLRSFSHLEEIILVLANEEENLSATPSSLSFESCPRSTHIRCWRNPRLPPEDILQFWWDFRQSFTTEENVLKEVCQELGKDYEGFSLPTVRVKCIDF